jgi:hypothetical protein
VRQGKQCHAGWCKAGIGMQARHDTGAESCRCCCCYNFELLIDAAAAATAVTP